MDIKFYLKDKQTLIDTFFRELYGRQHHPPILQEAMLYSLFAGGKRIRPILALAAYETCGGDPNEIVPYASTLELIHTYSLIHDDLPAMDNDDLRRGKPTNHKVYGEAVAILAGDALLTEAFSILSDTSLSSKVPVSHQMAALREIALASGLDGMVAGQVQDMLSENQEPDAETLQFIHSHKTGALLRASVRIGPILCGSSQEVLDALTTYGTNIGLAFQVIDDILDIEGDTEEMGKTAGSDEKINKMTYPRFYGLQRSKEIAQNLITNAKTALSLFSSEADPLREIADYLLTRRN
ncbi:MAG: polyprenyl synthetase family protein [Nitrospirae bacterium]|nr:polyprenyl synthetase family protein [Nitrospirota bacterium]